METKRQIILIMTDTQRKDMLGCYGNPDMKTPCLDRLAGQGLRFDRAYCCQPVCGPARSALFTGTYPHSNGCWANSIALGDNVRTVGQRLTDSGIRCAYMGKWHLDGSDYFGLGRAPVGWDPDCWYDMRNYLEELSEADRVRSRKSGTSLEGIDAGFTFAHRCSNRAIDYLDKHAGADFFLVVSYDEPHGPSLAPEPYASMYADYEFPKRRGFFDDLSGKPEHQRAWSRGFCDKSREEKEAFPLRNRGLLGCNSFVDSEIGRVLDAVDRHAPGALVIYTSDHGEMFGHHGMWGKGPVMYDDITNVPFLVRWPGTVEPGGACADPVSHINVVPTIMEYFSIARLPVIEGKSLLPFLQKAKTCPNERVFIEFNRYEIDHDGFGGYQPVRCVFDGRYKLVVNLLTSDELYDLQDDPDEMDNLIGSAEHAGIRNALHDRIIEWMNETRDPFRGYYWLDRPWRSDAPAPTWEFTGMTRQREEDPLYEPRQLDYGTGLEMDRAVREKG